MNFNMNPNSELVQSAVNVPNLVPVPDALISQAREFQMAMMMYTCAIREVKTKLEVLNDELSVRNQRNPIEVIKSRVKKPLSIVEKLQRRNLPVIYKTVEFKDMGKKHYQKLYFLNNRLCGVILIGDVSRMAELTEALEKRASYKEVL